MKKKKQGLMSEGEDVLGILRGLNIHDECLFVTGSTKKSRKYYKIERLK